MGPEVETDFPNSGAGLDMRVHADGIGDEQTGGIGKEEGKKFLLKVVGTLEVRVLASSNELQLGVNPNPKGI